MFECDNCRRHYNRDELRTVFPDIPDLTERIEPGGVVPAGECPWCGSLVYPRRVTPKVLEALQHAHDRLNAIAHNYADTDFKLIRQGIKQAREPIRVLILLEGGLVQGVVTDREDVEAAVLDQDLEGADEEEIVEVIGQADSLRGTLSASEVTVTPSLVRSAF